MANRRITLDAETRARMAEVCKVLGTTFEEFAAHAITQSLDEMEGYARDADAVRRYYERNPL